MSQSIISGILAETLCTEVSNPQQTKSGQPSFLVSSFYPLVVACSSLPPPSFSFNLKFFDLCSSLHSWLWVKRWFFVKTVHPSLLPSASLHRITKLHPHFPPPSRTVRYWVGGTMQHLSLISLLTVYTHSVCTRLWIMCFFFWLGLCGIAFFKGLGHLF